MANSAFNTGSDEESGLEGGVAIKEPRMYPSPPTPVPRHLQEPYERSPIPPPVGLEAVRMKNFAQFLRKSSTSPESRVTAGGRVVPVGPNALPPTFYMDFIDRIIQTAEEVEQDPTQKLANSPINWLQEPAGNQNVDYHVSEKAAAQTNGQPLNTTSNRALTSALRRERAKRLQLDRDFELVANLSDGGKLVRLGSALYHAFLDEYGETVVQALTDVRLSEKSPGAVIETKIAEDQTKQAVGLPQAVSQSMALIKSPTWDERVEQSQVIEHAPIIRSRMRGGMATPEDSLEHNTNMVYGTNDDYAFRRGHPSTTRSSLVPPVTKDEFLANLLKPPDELLSTVPADLIISEMAEIINIENSDITAELQGVAQPECERQLRAVNDCIELRNARLQGILKWLAAQSEIMTVGSYNKLIEEKGSLIRVLDKARKDKIKIKEVLLKKYGYNAPEPRGVSSTVLQVQRIMRKFNSQATSQQAYVPMINDVRPGNVYDMTCPEGNQIKAPLHHRQSTNFPLVPASVAEFSMQNRMDSARINEQGNLAAMEYVSQYSPSFFQDMESTGQPGEQVSAEMRLICLSGEEQALHKDNSQLHGGPHVVNSKQGKKAVTICRPDGTPISFEHLVDNQPSVETSQRGQTNVARELQRRHHTSNRSSASSAKAPAMSYLKAALEANDEATIKMAMKEIKWVKLPGESKEEYEQRCKEQREVMAKNDLLERERKQSLHLAKQRRTVSQSGFIDENHQLRPLRAHNPVVSQSGMRQGPMALQDYTTGQMVYHNVSDTRFTSSANDLQPSVHPYPQMTVRTPRPPPPLFRAETQINAHRMQSHPSMPNMRQVQLRPTQMSVNSSAGRVLMSSERDGFPSPLDEQFYKQPSQRVSRRQLGMRASQPSDM